MELKRVKPSLLRLMNYARAEGFEVDWPKYAPDWDGDGHFELPLKMPAWYIEEKTKGKGNERMGNP